MDTVSAIRKPASRAGVIRIHPLDDPGLDLQRVRDALFLEPGMSQADMVFAQARYADADKTELAAALSVHELVAPTRLELAGRRRRAPWWLVLYAFIRWTIPESLVDAFLDDDVTRIITWSFAFFIGVCMGLAIIFGTVHALWRP